MKPAWQLIDQDRGCAATSTAKSSGELIRVRRYREPIRAQVDGTDRGSER